MQILNIEMYQKIEFYLKGIFSQIDIYSLEVLHHDLNLWLLEHCELQSLTQMFTGVRLQFLSLTFLIVQTPLKDQLAGSIKKKKLGGSLAWLALTKYFYDCLC